MFEESIADFVAAFYHWNDNPFYIYDARRFLLQSQTSRAEGFVSEFWCVDLISVFETEVQSNRKKFQSPSVRCPNESVNEDINVTLQEQL